MLAFFGYGILFAIGQNMFGGRKYIREKEKKKETSLQVLKSDLQVDFLLM